MNKIAMNESLAEHFNIFIDKRMGHIELMLEDNALYQEQQNILYSMEDIPDSVWDKIKSWQAIKAKQAYKQGVFDGLSLMACIEN